MWLLGVQGLYEWFGGCFEDVELLDDLAKILDYIAQHVGTSTRVLCDELKDLLEVVKAWQQRRQHLLAGGQ
jgi:hypothetical protein